MSAIAPSPEAQLQFLSKLQRLFAEGDFTATYKFALLMALADLAIELGADDGHELMLTTRQLGLRFIGLYWNHALPYSSGRPACTAGVLAQSKGPQAAVLTAIAAFRLQTQVSTLLAAIRHPDFDALLSKVSATVSKQPLTYLQNFGGGTDEFIYTRTGRGQIRLKPGVAYCLRRFYTLLQQLTRTHWVGHLTSSPPSRFRSPALRLERTGIPTASGR
ncbi:hypothetical protein [Craterilacuibacter sp.]|uniref:hypothetical protein n=1 Tax=Craterilacuibacter sp. TaxID=2870909 RepID=UPI003F3B88B8